MVLPQAVTCFEHTFAHLARDLEVGHVPRLDVPRDIDPSAGGTTALLANPALAGLKHLAVDLVVQLYNRTNVKYRPRHIQLYIVLV